MLDGEGAEPLRETIRKKVVVAMEIAATAAAGKAASAGNASAGCHDEIP
jgi:hypothetical protein